MTAAKPLCVADGCHRPQHGRGYCATHLWRLKHVGSLDLQPRQPKPKKPCTVGECDAPMWAKGLCELHYKRWRKTEHLDALVVDHIDYDTFNNDVSNLVPSCNTCNFARRRPDGTRNKERSA